MKMAAIEPGEHELSDEGSHDASNEDDEELSQKTFFGHGGGHGDGGAPIGFEDSDNDQNPFAEDQYDDETLNHDEDSNFSYHRGDDQGEIEEEFEEIEDENFEENRVEPPIPLSQEPPKKRGRPTGTT